jgi:hypothetical protein
LATAVKKNTAIGVEIEDTEGTYKAPAAATSYVQTLTEGFEMNPAKELLERNIFTSSIGKTSPLTGQFQVNGAIPTEAKASSVEGAAPEIDALIRSALGTRRQITAEVTTKASGNTDDDLQIEDADIADFTVGDIVLVKESGAYHVSPISAVDSTGGAAKITLLIPHPDGNFSNSVVIAKSTVYTVADSAHPSLSISKYLEEAVLEQAVGCKVTSMSLENFTTGQIPSLNFGFEGLNFDRSLTAQPHTPSYNAGRPPIMLDGRVYMDTTAIDVNELSFSLENSLGFKSSIAAENGRVSSRATERTISGTINPYKEDDSIANFTKFEANTSFKLFAYGKVPSGVAGEFNQIVAVYMPNCIITELGEGDQDGLLQDSITFSANRGNAGTSNEIYIAFI